jgi:hypothetical protein
LPLDRKYVTMVLDAAHRASIFQKLRPILGDEDANALMSQYSAADGQELVTKDFLRAELAEIRSEMGALETRLTVRLGSAIAASTAALAAIGLLS